MECSRPNYMILREVDIDNKPHFTFIPHASYNKMVDTFPDGQFITVPCGHCIACKIAHSRSWADRITLEAKKYKDNYFITLTYDDDHLHKPRTDLKFKTTTNEDGDLVRYIDRLASKERGPNSLYKRDMQLFIKRLRRCLERRGFDGKLIFFGCGEYGDESLRSHLHLILLNCPLNDLSLDFKQLVDGKVQVYRRTGRDGLMFSELIWNCWHRVGEISVAPFSYDTASYVAQYCQKKYDPINSKIREDLKLAPEFVLMSKGIAADFASPSNYILDNIVVNGHVSAVPRYFDKLRKKVIGDDGFFDEVGYRRLNKKLIKLRDYNLSVRNKDRQRELQNRILITKNKLRNKI